MDSVELVLLNPVSWLSYAERCEPYVARMAAASQGRYIQEDIALAISTGQFQAWVVLEDDELIALMVTEVIQYPRKRALRGIGWVGRNPGKWVHFIQSFEQMGKYVFDCDLAEALHPPSIKMLFSRDGWSEFHRLSVKQL